MQNTKTLNSREKQMHHLAEEYAKDMKSCATSAFMGTVATGVGFVMFSAGLLGADVKTNTLISIGGLAAMAVGMFFTGWSGTDILKKTSKFKKDMKSTESIYEQEM